MTPTNLSVIIPTYNYATYIPQAIESARRQLSGGDEIIVVDDGSVDNTRAVVLGLDDRRVHYHFQPNRGQSAARNTGIRHAANELLLMLDADDILLPNALEALRRTLLQDPPVGLAAGGWYLQVEREGGCRVLHSPWRAWPDLEAEDQRWVLSTPFVTTGAVMVRRSAVERVGMFDEALRYCNDWDLWLRLKLDGCRMRWAPQPVVVYRVHGANSTASHKPGSRALDAHLRVLSKLFARGDLPPRIQSMRSAAFAHAYLQGAMGEVAAGLSSNARRSVEAAIDHDSRLAEDGYRRVFEMITSWATTPTIADPLWFVDAAIRALPPAAGRLSRPRRRAVAIVALHVFYRAFEAGDWRASRRAFRRAAASRPSLLRNRGVVKTFGLSLLNAITARARPPGDRGSIAGS